MRTYCYQCRMDTETRNGECDAELIAHSPTDLARLIAVVETLSEALQYYSDENDWREHYFKLPFVNSDSYIISPPKSFLGYAKARKAQAEAIKIMGGGE